jgi:hypothetical protein
MGSFQIPDPNQTAIPGTAVVFTVTNVGEEDLQARISIPGDPAQLEALKIPADRAAKSEWFSFDGTRERNFPAGAGTTVGVTATAPAGTKPGDYLFCLQVASITDPDNDSARSPVITLSVAEQAPEPEKKPPTKWWLWILIALAVLAALGVGGWLIFRDKGGNDTPAEAPVASGAAWFTGTLNGTIDGRPAIMRWKDNGEKKQPRFTGDYSFDNGQTFRPLTYVSHKSNQFDFKAGANPWQLTKVGNGQFAGWASFDGERFPVALQK